VIEGFFLDGIDVNCHGASVDEAPHFTACVHPGAASTPLPWLKDATLGAEQTFDEAALVGMATPELFPGAVALAAVIACQGDRRPVSRPGGLADERFLPVLGKDASPFEVPEHLLQEGVRQDQTGTAQQGRQTDQPGQEFTPIEHHPCLIRFLPGIPL
jgi:hypothetical protein